MKTKLVIFLGTLCAFALFGFLITFRDPLLDVKFADGFQYDRRVKLIAIDPMAKKQLLHLVKNLQRDTEEWDNFNAFINSLETSSTVIETIADGLQLSMRVPKGYYFLISSDKRAAFVGFVELKSDTVLSLGRDDYVVGY